MITEILSASGEKQEKIELPDNIFQQKPNPSLVWEAVNNFLANQRQGTAKTKTKGEVRGGGKKPWRQKHTGRARAGSIRSPIWVGGGTVFGPSPRDYSFHLPKKKRRKALLVALTDKVKTSNLKIISDVPKDVIKTKEIVKILAGFGVTEGRTLLLLDSVSENLVRSTRNIPNLDLKSAKNLNVYDVISADQVIFTKAGIEQFISEIGNKIIEEKAEAK
jgi:large subunit ribosomal protein L4